MWNEAFYAPISFQLSHSLDETAFGSGALTEIAVSFAAEIFHEFAFALLLCAPASGGGARRLHFHGTVWCGKVLLERRSNKELKQKLSERRRVKSRLGQVLEADFSIIAQFSALFSLDLLLGPSRRIGARFQDDFIDCFGTSTFRRKEERSLPPSICYFSEGQRFLLLNFPPREKGNARYVRRFRS